VRFMRKLIVLMSVFFVASVSAQVTSSTGNDQPMKQEQVSDSDSALEDSFLRVAEIGQNIEMTNKEIEAARLQSQLASLQKVQSMRDLGFAVYQILGYGKTLSVILVTTSGSFLELGPGDMINGQYRVNLITPMTVKAMEVRTGKIFNVPFNKPTITDSKGKAVAINKTVAAQQLISAQNEGTSGAAADNSSH
jgi:hypothetical protein